MISGLGLAVQPSGVRTYFLARMVRGRRRYARIGDAETMTVPEARGEARRLIASYIEPVKTGNSPKTPGHPMTEFADEFLERYARHWKPVTLENSAYIVRKYILPTFGHITVDAIAVEHVRDWFASMADRPGSANRAHADPVRDDEAWPSFGDTAATTPIPARTPSATGCSAKERFLTAEEMARLNAVLTRDEFYCPHIVAIVRLLMLTGCRFGEIVSLEWDWIKGKRILLPDSKSGPRTVWLSSAARAVIDAIPRYSDDCPFLFPTRPPVAAHRQH